MSARAALASGAGVLDRLQVVRSAPTPLRGAPAATWPRSPRPGVGQLRAPDIGLPPRLHDTTTTSTDPAGSTLGMPGFGPKDGVHLKGQGLRPAASPLRGLRRRSYGGMSPNSSSSRRGAISRSMKSLTASRIINCSSFRAYMTATVPLGRGASQQNRPRESASSRQLLATLPCNSEVPRWHTHSNER